MDINNFITKEREEIARFINPEYLLENEKETHYSPSGKYKLELNHYLDSGQLEDGAEYQHNFMNIKIFRGDRPIYSLNGTTYFYFAWVEKSCLEEYLICTEYYQGYGTLNLNTLEYDFYLPLEAMNGMGYIWADGHLSPDFRKIAVEGCIWAAPYQIKIFDISDPMKLPYPCLFETTMDDEYGKVIGWKNKEEFQYTDSNGTMITASF